MSLEFDTHWNCCLLLPLLAITDVVCDCCQESNGFAVVFGWLFWEIILECPIHD